MITYSFLVLSLILEALRFIQLTLKRFLDHEFRLLELLAAFHIHLLNVIYPEVTINDALLCFLDLWEDPINPMELLTVSP